MSYEILTALNPPLRHKNCEQEKRRVNLEPLPREIFTPLNSKIVQLGHDSDSEVHPIKLIFFCLIGAYFNGVERRTP